MTADAVCACRRPPRIGCAGAPAVARTERWDPAGRPSSRSRFCAAARADGARDPSPARAAHRAASVLSGGERSLSHLRPASARRHRRRRRPPYRRFDARAGRARARHDAGARRAGTAATPSRRVSTSTRESTTAPSSSGCPQETLLFDGRACPPADAGRPRAAAPAFAAGRSSASGARRAARPFRNGRLDFRFELVRDGRPLLLERLRGDADGVPGMHGHAAVRDAPRDGRERVHARRRACGARRTCGSPRGRDGSSATC